jgi:hypothetical protein
MNALAKSMSPSGTPEGHQQDRAARTGRLHPVRIGAALAGALLTATTLLSACGRNEVPPSSPAATVSSAAPGAAASEKPTPKPLFTPRQKEPAVTAAAEPDAASPAGTTPAAAASPSAVPPTSEALSVFPGILRAMVLTREETLSLLGEGHETFANMPLAYTVHTWENHGLSLEYDDLSGKLRTIRAGGRTFFLEGADYREADLDGDGVPEGICAYEATASAEGDPAGNAADAGSKRQGHVTVLNQQTGGLLAETMVSTFDGYARVSFLPAYGTASETMVILDTQADWECDVLTYTGGQLVSMLPADTLQLTSEALVSTGEAHPDRVTLAVPPAGLSFDCTLPDKLVASMAEGIPFSHRFVTNRKPVVTDEGLSLRVRHSLQVLLGNATAMDGTSIERHLDVGHVTQEYRYMGAGKWELLSTAGAAKYAEAAQGSNLYMEDMVAGQTYLFSTLYDIEETYGLDPARYSDFDLIAGLRFIHKGLRIKVVNARVASMEADEACPLETVRGLKTGDSRGAALSALGLPDVGYFEDRIWTYWFYRGFDAPGERVLSLDRLTVEFSGDKVARIRMEGYVPID